MINPNQFIIKRKRKKYKFAKFFNAQNCFEYQDWSRKHVDCVEIGAGTGLFSVELASRHPDKTFVAVDVKADRLQKGAYEAIERGIENVYFIRARADQIGDLFLPKSVSTVWVTFPDPFPKKRSSGRRLTHKTFLGIYRAILKEEGCVRLKHDDPTFFCWSLEQFVKDGWMIDALSFDVHESSLSDEIKTTTTYESRWMKEGRVIGYASARPRCLGPS